MKINHNLQAVIANNRLHKNEDMVSKSMERLSSGLSINHAKDNPAGMAMSKRLQTQIDGLDRASSNSTEVQSLLNTAEGALNEITSMAQRIRELCVQAANDSNTTTDKEEIQMEVQKLKEEIDRMSKDTEYNTRSLLDGTFNHRFYSSKTRVDDYGVPQEDMTRIDVSEAVTPGLYSLKANAGTKAQLGGSTMSMGDDFVATEAQEGIISINGFQVAVHAGDTKDEILKNLQYGAEKGETSLDFSGGNLLFTATRFGSAAEINVKVDNPRLAAALGLSAPCYVAGLDAKVDKSSLKLEGKDDFYEDATVTTEGNRVHIKKPNGFSIDFLLDENIAPQSGAKTWVNPVTGDQYASAAEARQGLQSGGDIGYGSIIGYSPEGDVVINPAESPREVSLEITSMAGLQGQVGAGEDQTLMMRIPRIDTKMLYIDDLDCSTVTGADRGIAMMDSALAYINELRSKIGAYDNRLEHTIQALDQNVENTTSALSRLSDVDMAKEMTNYTAGNVLVQAATSVLAQANDQPESVLQLLQ